MEFGMEIVEALHEITIGAIFSLKNSSKIANFNVLS